MAEMKCRFTSGFHPNVVWVKHYQINNSSYKGEDGTPYYRKVSPNQVNFYAKHEKNKSLAGCLSLSLLEPCPLDAFTFRLPNIEIE